MNIQLIQQPDLNNSGLETVLINRGIPKVEIRHWLNTTDRDINDFLLLGEDKLKHAAQLLMSAVSNEKKILVIVDADADGFCSSALFINYLFDLFPAWARQCVQWFIHSGKQHGLSDVNVDQVAADGFAQVWCPDASSGDYEYHLAFVEKGIDIIALDHHEAPIVSPNAVIINNQLSDYPNKSLCGAGITWQFCRYLDSLMSTHYAENYIDLVSLALISDMMSLREFETKHLIFKGLRAENIHNPLLAAMIEKQEYSISKKSIPNGVAWYITPFINAIVRSGEAVEKELVFKSFLKFYAFDTVLSDKRGHKPGATEQLVTQALRVMDRVKRRQTSAQDSAMEELELMIKQQSLLEHKALLFLLKPGQVDRNVAGLIANKLMGKYQRPCAILTQREQLVEGASASRIEVVYEGSARGCDAKGVIEFKDICKNTGMTEYCSGHQGAFGLGLREENVEPFLLSLDRALSNMPEEQLYYVDYIYQGNNVNEEQLLSISSLSDLYGKDITEALIAIEGLKVNRNMVTVYKKKNNTLKITLPNKVALIQFDAPDALCKTLQETKGWIKIDLVGKVSLNNYQGNISAQVLIEDYEVTEESQFDF